MNLFSRLQKILLIFADLWHLWSRCDIRLSTQGRVYTKAMESVLLYGPETWPLRAGVVRRLLASEHSFL